MPPAINMVVSASSDTDIRFQQQAMDHPAMAGQKEPEHVRLSEKAQEISRFSQRVMHDLLLEDIPSRAAFVEKMQKELTQLSCSSPPLSLVLIGVDHVKLLNDTYGCLASNQILQAVANKLRRIVRAADFLARYGECELAVVLPKTPLSGATAVAERLRAIVEGTSFYCEFLAFKIKLNVAIANAQPQDALATILVRAEQALDTARERSGRQVRTQPDT